MEYDLFIKHYVFILYQIILKKTKDICTFWATLSKIVLNPICLNVSSGGK